MTAIVTIWIKELKDTLRDRRTVISMVVMPLLLMPLLIVGLGKLVEYQTRQTQEQTITLAVTGASSAPDFIEMVSQLPKIKIINASESPEKDLKDDAVDAVIEIPDSFAKDLESRRATAITVITKSTSTRSAVALSRLQVLIQQYSAQVVRQRLENSQIDPGILTGVTATVRDVATNEERGGFGLGFLLPMFIVLWSMNGGMYTAIDVSAGEKERKTLESLLLTPARRIEIVMGKFLAVSTVSLVSVVIALSSLYITIAKVGFGITNTSPSAMPADIAFNLQPQAIAIMFGTSLLLVAMFSAILLSIAIFAKSFKEAQSYLSPAYLVIILPVVAINTIPNFKPGAEFFLIPVVNSVLLFKEVLVGIYSAQHLLYTVASLLVFSLAAIYISTRIYSREGVLFKD